MTTEQIDSLIQAAGRIAAGAAREYLARHKLTAQPAALADCLRSWIKAKFPEALNDAAEANACHMTAAAVQTFGASMMQAGIEAAKEAGYKTERAEPNYSDLSTPAKYSQEV